MDGTIKDLEEREKCVSRFQNNDTHDTFLLTTQVACYGFYMTKSQINLTDLVKLCDLIVRALRGYSKVDGLNTCH